MSSKENVSSNTSTCEISGLNHWFTIWDKAIISCPTCNTNIALPIGDYGGVPNTITVSGIEVEVRSITHLELEKAKKDPFKGADKTKILKLMYKDRIELINPTGCITLYYIMRYIRKPVIVSLNGNITCELSEHTHDEILDLAIQLALEGIEAKRTQTFTPIVNNQNE